MKNKQDFTINLTVGVRWVCPHCKARIEETPDDGWPVHCGDVMKMVPFYRLHPAGKPEARCISGESSDCCGAPREGGEHHDTTGTLPAELTIPPTQSGLGGICSAHGLYGGGRCPRCDQEASDEC